jgi:hypothetical protein
VTNSTTGIGTVKLLSGTKCSYRLTVAVTDIVTKTQQELVLLNCINTGGPAEILVSQWKVPISWMYCCDNMHWPYCCNS